MVSAEQKQKLASGILIFVGGFIAVFAWSIGGISAILYIIIGILVMGVGYTRWTQQYEYAPYIRFIAGVVILTTAIGRAIEYSLTNGLAIALFILGIVLFYRGYQYYQAI